MSSFPRAAVAKSHRLSVLNSRHVLSLSSGGWKSTTEALARWTLPPSEAVRGNLFPSSLPTSRALLAICGVAGLQVHPFNLCFHCIQHPPCAHVYLCVRIFSFSKIMTFCKSWWVKAHPSEFISTWLSLKRPCLQVRSHSELFRVQGFSVSFFWGGHNSKWAPLKYVCAGPYSKALLVSVTTMRSTFIMSILQSNRGSEIVTVAI